MGSSPFSLSDSGEGRWNDRLTASSCTSVIAVGPAYREGVGHEDRRGEGGPEQGNAAGGSQQLVGKAADVYLEHGP